MATAGERYEERTGNIWSYANRGDLTGLRAAIARGVDVNIPNTVGWTACHAAAAGGKTNAIRFLAKVGADLSIADRGGLSPAHQAAKNGHVHVLKTLQELGADVSKVRLSQVKGKAARDFVISVYCKANKMAERKDHGGTGCDNGNGNGNGNIDSTSSHYDEYIEEDVAVGYARKQSKSTAFWGPRRTPISTKIKKKIMKEKRKERKDKKQQRNAEIQTMIVQYHEQKDGDDGLEIQIEDENQLKREGIDDNVIVVNGDQETLKNEPGFVEVVQQMKRIKKQKRLQKEGRRKNQHISLQNVLVPDADISESSHSSNSPSNQIDDASESSYESYDVNNGRPNSDFGSRFSAFSIAEDSDSD